MQTKRLEMIFQNTSGNRVTVSVLDPKADLTAEAIQAVMEQIISLNVFSSSGGQLTAVLGARVVTRDVNELLVM